MKRAFALGILLLSGAARAQTTGVEAGDPATVARTHFDRGIAHLEARAFDAAIVEFRRSFTALPTRGAGQNMTLALEELGRFDEALDTAEETQKRFPQMKESDRLALADLVTRLERRVGFVQIRSEEPNAKVTVDNVERGSSQEQPIRVSAGAHTLRVTKSGFLPFEARVEVAAREVVSVQARMPPLLVSGRLSVSEDQNRAVDVAVDGVVVGRTPWEGTVPVGKHAVQLRGDGSLGTAPSAAEITANHLTKLTLLAEPLACRFRVRPTPSNAMVAIDGVEVGTGVWSGPLRCGGHRVEASADGFVAKALVVSLNEARETEGALSLDRDPGYGKIPTRVVFGSSASVLTSTSLGGDPSTACGDGCSRDFSLGGMATAFGGARFGSGLGVGAGAGYAVLGGGYEGRAASATPAGHDVNVGRADERIHLGGPHVGAYVGYSRGETWSWRGRLQGGVMFATYESTRDLSLSTSSTANVAYRTPGLVEHGSLVVPYVVPEVGISRRIAASLSLDFALVAPIFFGLDRAQWRGSSSLYSGECPSLEPGRCQGVATTRAESLFSSVVVSLGPQVGLSGEL